MNRKLPYSEIHLVVISLVVSFWLCGLVYALTGNFAAWLVPLTNFLGTALLYGRGSDHA